MKEGVAASGPDVVLCCCSLHFVEHFFATKEIQAKTVTDSSTTTKKKKNEV